MAGPATRRLRMSPRAYRAVTLAAVVLLAAIMVTGGAVRVTGSGLGCPDWPTCDEGNLAPELFAPSAGHATIEYLNRLVTGLVSLVVIVAVLGALVRTPRRRDLTRLSLTLVGGVVGQIILGGITVKTHLHPLSVQSHFLLSVAILVGAVNLHERAGWPDDRRPQRGDPVVRRASLVTVGLLVCALVAGTVLTATGPHSGGEDTQRFLLHPPTVARVHGVLVELFTAALLVALVLAWRRGAPRRALTRGSVAVVVAIAQTAVGYTQYFTGVPALLVGIHIAGATLLWIAVLRFHLSLGAVTADPPPAPADVLAAVA